MNIQQAIFASARTASGSGYQLVARSPGILELDAQELAVWGPSHDALWDPSGHAASVNYFPLPGGAVCVSKTAAAGAEYSGRGGQHVVTQCFVLERDQFARFSNNPFALLKALTAQGAVAAVTQPGAKLPTISLVGRASVVDVDAVTHAQRLLGSARLAGLIQAALVQPSLGILTADDPRPILAAVLNCLPVECRSELSLSTGLRYSPQRPFRLSACPAKSGDARRLERVYGMGVIDLAANVLEESLDHGWARFIVHVLENGRVPELRQALTVPHPGLSCKQLDELGRDLLALFQRQRNNGLGRPTADTTPLTTAPAPSADRQSTNHNAAGGFRVVREANSESDATNRRADGVHIKFNHTVEAQAKLQAAESRIKLADLATDPADVLSAVCPRAQAQLELLDDTVFEAIAGKAEAMHRLHALWPQVLRELGPDLIEESQVQYLRHALSVWRNYTDEDAGSDPLKAGRALDVLCLLLDDRAAAAH